MGLRLREDSGEDPRCAECRERLAVGPCAACEAMICADCGLLSPDPEGKKVICASCARLVAGVSDRAPERRGSGQLLIVAVLLLVVAVGFVAALSR